MRMEAVEAHENPMGTVQGGIFCALADGAMGLAFFSTLEDGESFTTLELKMNYLRPFTDRRHAARARQGPPPRPDGRPDRTCDVVDAERPPARPLDEHLHGPPGRGRRGALSQVTDCYLLRRAASLHASQR